MPTILEEAASLVYGDREEDYGHPRDNMAAIANLWEAYLGAKDISVYLSPGDVAAMLALLKMARYATGKHKRDTYVDLAGYAAVLARVDGIDE